MQTYEGRVAPPGEGKIAIVVSKFNKTVTQALLDGCVAKLKQNSVRDGDITVAWVPGAFELPTVAARFTDDEEYQAVICLGCIIKGETPHDAYIARAVSSELARLGVDTGMPVIFGVLTCDTNEQAMARAGLSAADEMSHDKLLGEKLGNKGVEAAEAALEMLDLFIQLPELEDEADEPDEEKIFYNAKRFKAGGFDDEPDDDDFEEDEASGRDEFDGRFAPKRFGGHKPSGKSFSSGKGGGKPYPPKGARGPKGGSSSKGSFGKGKKK